MAQGSELHCYLDPLGWGKLPQQHLCVRWGITVEEYLTRFGFMSWKKKIMITAGWLKCFFFVPVNYPSVLRIYSVKFWHKLHHCLSWLDLGYHRQSAPRSVNWFSAEWLRCYSQVLCTFLHRAPLVCSPYPYLFWPDLFWTLPPQRTWIIIDCQLLNLRTDHWGLKKTKFWSHFYIMKKWKFLKFICTASCYYA